MQSALLAFLFLLLVLVLPQSAFADSTLITRIVFTTLPQTIDASTASAVMTVQTQNAGGTSEQISGGPQSIAFTSSSGTGEFSNANSSACTGSFSTAPFTLTMSTGTANKNFCYRDATAGTHTLTVNAQGQSWTGATQSVVVNAPPVPPAPPPAPDTTPVQFTFSDRAGVSVDSEIVSDSITVSGVDAAAAISITGGEYSINGSAYTAALGAAVSGDAVAVRNVSGTSNGAAVHTTLTIGGVSDTFTSTAAVAAGGGGTRRERERSKLEAAVETSPSKEAVVSAALGGTSPDVPAREMTEMERQVRGLQMQVLDLAREWVLEMEAELAARG